MAPMWLYVFGALLAALLGGACVFLAVRSGQRRGEDMLRAENERLRDEVWRLRDQAAARSRAEAASDAKSRFLATVSHEIRTPLNGVLGLADLLRATRLTREQRSYIDAIVSSGEALTSIIHEILDFSRIEAGHLELNPQPMNLATLVEGVAELLAPRAQGKGLEIAVWVSAHLPPKPVLDGARIRQVLLNLAGNAVKFTEKGGVGLSVERIEGDLIRFSVIDTGPGVPEQLRGLIFNEFEMGDATATRRHGGTGLGLAISRRIVEGMGGGLNLQSPPGGGANFYFTVPLLEEAGDPPPPEPARKLTCRVLIVALSPFEGPFMARRLQEAGAQVTQASPDELTQALAREKFDVLLVDCALGEAQTAQVATKARAAGVRRVLVLFSPYERQTFGANAAQGFDGWLVKPVRAESLLQRIWPVSAPQPQGTDAQAHIPEQLPEDSRRILLAEDDPVSQLVAQRMLERLGGEVSAVGNGEAAVAQFRAALAGDAPFDICLMDIRMPNLTGLEAARAIRAAERAAHRAPARLVALSANAFDEDRIAALEAGFDIFLVKPVSFARLAEALRRADAAHTS